MTAKKYLSQARYLDARINSKIKQVEQLNFLATNATSALTGMPHSPNKASSKMADIVDKIIDLQAEINRDIDELVDLKREITAVIRSIDDQEQQTILEKRYLCFLTMESISVELGYSIQHTYRLHDTALKKIIVPTKDEKNVIECDIQPVVLLD